MSASLQLSPSTGLVHLPHEFKLRYGGVIRDGVLAFERQGPLDAPLVVALGGIASGKRVCGAPQPGWWQKQAGPGRLFDAQRVQWLSFDWLGGAGQSSAPDSSLFGMPEQWVLANDQARCLALVLDVLGVERAALVVGASFGGQVALAFGEMFPQRVGRLALLGAAHRVAAHTTVQRTLARSALALGAVSGLEREGVALARALGLVTYLGPLELDQRAANSSKFETVANTDVADWILEHAGRFALDFDANALWRLLWALDLFSIDPEGIDVPLACVAFEGDQVVPEQHVREMHERCARPAGFTFMETSFGHDAFLREVEAVGAWLLAQREAALQARAGVA